VKKIDPNLKYKVKSGNVLKMTVDFEKNNLSYYDVKEGKLLVSHDICFEMPQCFGVSIFSNSQIITIVR